jgi:hypothetical protein
MSRGIVAVALTPAKREYLLRILRDRAEIDDEPQAADVLAMLENALHPAIVSGLDKNAIHDEAWWK